MNLSERFILKATLKSEQQDFVYRVELKSVTHSDEISFSSDSRMARLYIRFPRRASRYDGWWSR